VPATFRPPDAPDPRILVVNQAGPANAEIRLAVRDLKRSDRDQMAVSMLSRIMRARIQAAAPPGVTIAVKDETHALPGMLVISASAPATSASRVVSAMREAMNSLASGPPSNAELETARSEAIAEMNGQGSQADSIANAWLDIETYKLPRFTEQGNVLRSLTAADLQRVAVRLFKGANVAGVVVGNSEQLKESLGSTIELSVEAPPKPVPISVTPATKP